MSITSSPVGPSGGPSNASLVDLPGHGGLWATMLSAVAFLFSGLSFYESSLKQPDIEVYVPPVIHYARESGGDIELFAIPITISNEGAKTGTVLAMELVVENPAEKAEPKSRTFYSAFMGEHPRNPDAPRKAFAPVSIPGRSSFSETIRFMPQGNPLPRLVEAEGDYRFTLKLVMAVPTNPSLIDRIFSARPPDALSFMRRLPWISDQQLGMRRLAIEMHAKDWKPTTSGAKP